MKQQVIIYHTDGEIVKLPQNYFNYYILWYNVKMTSPENTEGTERVVVETIDAMEDPPEDPTRSQRIADGVMAQIGEIEDDPGLFGGQRLDPDVHRVLDADSNRAFTKALREKRAAAGLSPRPGAVTDDELARLREDLGIKPPTNHIRRGIPHERL